MIPKPRKASCCQFHVGMPLLWCLSSYSGSGRNQKFGSTCGVLAMAFPLASVDKLKKTSYLFAPPSPTNYDKAIYIVSSNLCLFTCTPGYWLSMKSLPTERHISAKRVFLKFILVFLVNFSNNNMSISQAWVNIKKTEHDTTFEISLLLKLLGENFS